MQDGGGAESAQDEWGAGEGATVSSPLLDRTKPYTPPDARTAGDLALPRPAELPRVAVRAEHGGVPGDQGGPYYDYGGVWGADPVGETPKPYPVETAWPLPVHWGQGEGESIADDTAFDEGYSEVRASAHFETYWPEVLAGSTAPSRVQWCMSLHHVNLQHVFSTGVRCRAISMHNVTPALIM